MGAKLKNQQQVILPDGPQSYSLRRSRRAKHILLHVDVGGKVELVVPWHVAYREGQRFVEERKEWLEKMLRAYRELGKSVAKRRLISGDLLPVLGHDYLLQVVQQPSRQRSIVVERYRLLTVTVGRQHDVREALVRWYRKRAHDYFSMWAQRLAEQLNVTVERVAVSGARTQWGSCIGSRRRLSLNWRLLLAPESVARYVVAHEVAHLKMANHSKRYWQLVGQLDPDFERSRQWLRKYGYTLVL